MPTQYLLPTSGVWESPAFVMKMNERESGAQGLYTCHHSHRSQQPASNINTNQQQSQYQIGDARCSH